MKLGELAVRLRTGCGDEFHSGTVGVSPNVTRLAGAPRGVIGAWPPNTASGPQDSGSLMTCRVSELFLTSEDQSPKIYHCAYVTLLVRHTRGSLLEVFCPNLSSLPARGLQRTDGPTSQPVSVASDRDEAAA